MSVTLPDQTETDSSMMFIAAKPATARHLHQPARLARLVGLGALGLERMRRDSRCARARRSPRPASSSLVAPVDREPAVGEVEPRVDDAGQLLQAVLDLADAAGAADALDREVHVRSAVVARSTNSERSRVSVMAVTSAQHDAVLGAEQPLAVARELDDEIPLAGGTASALPRNWPARVSLQRDRDGQRGGRSGCDERDAGVEAGERLAGARRARRRRRSGRAVAARRQPGVDLPMQRVLRLARPPSRARRQARPDRSFRSRRRRRSMTAARIMTALTPATTAKKATRQTSTIRPVSFSRPPPAALPAMVCDMAALMVPGNGRRRSPAAPSFAIGDA